VLGVEELFERHADFVAKFLWRMGAPEAEIDDLVQDVFLVAHQRGGFREESARATTWLAAIAFRIWGTRRRRHRTRRELSDPESITRAVSPERGPEHRLEDRRSLERVRAALQQLDESARALLVLVDIEGVAGPDVALALGVPVGTVYSRLHKARKRFAQAYEKLLEPSNEGGADR
jgi:RNA polymerase sigma-70 factor (ECF subfamily)